MGQKVLLRLGLIVVELELGRLLQCCWVMETFGYIYSLVSLECIDWKHTADIIHTYSSVLASSQSSRRLTWSRIPVVQATWRWHVSDRGSSISLRPSPLGKEDSHRYSKQSRQSLWSRKPKIPHKVPFVVWVCIYVSWVVCVDHYRCPWLLVQASCMGSSSMNSSRYRVLTLVYLGDKGMRWRNTGASITLSTGA